jgi:hypothetical protein
LPSLTIRTVDKLKKDIRIKVSLRNHDQTSTEGAQMSMLLHVHNNQIVASQG